MENGRSGYLAPCRPGWTATCEHRRVNAQPGIFALGTSEHAYLEFDLHPGVRPAQLVAGAASLVDPLSTTGGVNLVIGFRPEMRARAADPEEILADAHGWLDDLSLSGSTLPEVAGNRRSKQN